MAITKVTRTLLSTGIVDNSNATAITIDSSENVGIGTSSPLSKMTIAQTAGNTALTFQQTNNGTTNFLIGCQYNVGNAFEITPSTAAGGSTFNTPALVVDSSGIVGIGNTVAGTIHGVSTVSNLVVGTGSGNNGIGVYSGTSNLGALTFADGTSGNATYRGGVTYNHSTDHLELNVNGGSAHVIVHSSGVTSIPFGVELGSGVDATTANTLDDYEEGTWTPTFSSSNSTATGSYTKIGNQVTVHFRVISTGGLPSGASQVQVGNLPFTIGTNFGGVGGLYVGPSDVTSATGGGGTIVPYVTGGETVIRFLNVDTGTFGYTIWGELEVSHNNVVTAIGTVTYQV